MIDRTMPYHISQSDSLSEGQRYDVSIVDELDASTARHLDDWLEAAEQNPAASFVLDVSRATDVNDRALNRLVARHRKRIEIVSMLMLTTAAAA